MSIERRKPLTARVGIYGIGLDTYWRQYPGLREQLLGYMGRFEAQVRGQGVETVNFGLVDEARAAYRALAEMKAAGLDLLFCDMLTYGTSATWGIICRELNVPIVLVALQPRQALDYARATTAMQLANDNICALPEFMGVAVRMGKKPPPVIIGTLEQDARAAGEVARWCGIAKVRHGLRGARLGQMGHVLEAMLDMHFDPTAFTAQFGLHVVQCEPDEVMRHFREIRAVDVDRQKEQILEFFDAPAPGADPDTEQLSADDLTMAARVYLALQRFIDEKTLDGLAYYYEGEPGTPIRELVTNFIVGNSLLTAAGFPMCGELDLKTCAAMLIMDRLGIGGSFAEFHPVDFTEGFILVGHDGPHHLNIAEGRPRLRSLKQYHGKPGHGASVEFQIRAGPITMLSIGQTATGRFKLVVAEGEARKGLIPATGNTNTRGFFGPDPVAFLQRWLAEGPTHHFALGTGHHAQTIKLLADTLDVECAVVSEPTSSYPDWPRGPAIS